MSMRLVKQQLAALSSNGTEEVTGGHKNHKKQSDQKKRVKKKVPKSGVSKKTKSDTKRTLTETEIRQRNLEYLRNSGSASKSLDVMNKVHQRPKYPH